MHKAVFGGVLILSLIGIDFDGTWQIFRPMYKFTDSEDEKLPKIFDLRMGAYGI